MNDTPEAHVTHKSIKFWRNQVVFDAKERNTFLSKVVNKIVIKNFERGHQFVQVTESTQTIRWITDKPPTSLV